MRRRSALPGGPDTPRRQDDAMPMNTRAVTSERDGLLAFLEQQRQAVRNACFGLSDDQARREPTPSVLSLGGLVKHLAYGERTWLERVQGGGPERDGDMGAAMAEYLGASGSRTESP